VQINELEYYGYEEGDTSVDVVHRSIPNKPGQQHLEVYWDANDSNSYSFADSSSVYDLSGSGVTGTLTNGVGFDTEYNAFTFDGTSQYIEKVFSGYTQANEYSASVWFKSDSYTSDSFIFQLGLGDHSNGSGIGMNIESEGPLRAYIYGYGLSSNVSLSVDTIATGIWYHATATYYSTGKNELYVNGVLVGEGNTPQIGTISASAPLTIGTYYVSSARLTPTFNGSIANFRLFGKALNADQVRELYEYDAPRFGHRQNLVSLHKGNLGVGVAHPTSRFEIAGDERIQEYPPRAMTDYETYIEGHGVFRASQSSPYPAANYTAWKVFDKGLTYGAHWLDSYSSTADYIYDGAGTRSDGLGGFSGEWVMLEMPYAINLKSFAIAPASVTRAPEDFVILGSNDGTLWTQLINYTGLGSSDWPYSGGQYILKHFDVPSTKHYYRYFAIVVTRTESNDYLQIDLMQYYGTPASSTLDDGHLTLGKALTTPRVSGHTAGAETPRAESLVVHYDTTVDSVVSGSTVVDISGEGSNGTLTNGAAYSSTDRALTFDGVDDYVRGAIPSSLSGNHPYTFSLWIKPDAIQSNFIAVFEMGNRTTNQSCGLYLNGGSIVHLTFANNLATSTSVVPNQWIHITGTYTSGSRKIYADGVLLATDTYSSLNIGATEMTLGANNDDLQKFDGSISNFKLWNVVLTAEEVAMEYALGRTGKSLNLTDTSLCLGGTAPRAQLDVRGSALIGGNVGIGTTNPQDKLHIYGTDSQLFQIQNTNDTARMVLNGASGTGGDLIFKQNGTPTWGIASIGDKLHFLGDDSTSQYRMTLDNSGNVGIGTTSPDEKLHVNGNILTNNFRFNSVRKTVNLAHNTTTTVHTMTSGDCGLLFAISAIGNGQHFGVMIFQWTSGRSSASTHTIFNSGYSTFTSNSTNIWIKHNDSNGATLSTDIRILKF
jgi:hypothetical protein